jgi:hypothetical protein
MEPDSFKTHSWTEAEVIGVYIALPNGQQWGDGGCNLFDLHLSGALLPVLVKQTCTWHDNELLALIDVNDLSAALKIIATELRVMRLLSLAHVAWRCDAEGVWRNEIPKCCPAPFEQRIQRLHAWLAHAKATAAIIEEGKVLVAEMRNALVNPPPPAP